MFSYNDAFFTLLNELKSLYDSREAAAIANEVIHEITGLDKLQRLLEKDKVLPVGQQERFEQMKAALLTGKPMQYVLGYAWFMRRPFKVNNTVLIPRPETEELVQWIIDDWKGGNISILDIGTGSGCIPISLKLELPDADVTTCDVSTGALNTARENAGILQAGAKFLQLDFLQQDERDKLSAYDVIVSNPPYIPVTEKEQLDKNVRDFEPALALFVPGDDPILFYRKIAIFGKTHLKAGGAVYCELHVEHAGQTQTLFRQEGYRHVEIRRDMHGNLRLLKAQ